MSAPHQQHVSGSAAAAIFDDNATKQETKRTKLNGARTMSLVESDVAVFYRKHEGSGDHCEIETVDRHLEGWVQLTLYTKIWPTIDPSSRKERCNGYVAIRQ